MTGRNAYNNFERRDFISFQITGAPRTKKTSNRIVRFGRNKEFIRILPSAAHEEWFSQAMTQAPMILTALRDDGFDLPLTGPVHVAATFYREALVGDLLGYEQALADWLQKPIQRSHRGKWRLIRGGAGIIVDDAQIVSWDGSRLAKDSKCPRIEVAIIRLGAEQLDLEPVSDNRSKEVANA